MYQSACVSINNSNPISNASYLFKNNTLHSEAAYYGFNIAFTEGSNNYFLSKNNNIYASGTAGVNITASNTMMNTPHVFDITNCNIKTYDDYGVELILNNASIAQLNIIDSTIDSLYGIYIITNNQSQLTAKIVNNTFNVYEYAFEPETYNSSSINAIFANNTVNSYDYPIYILSENTSTISVNIRNNTMSCYEYAIYTDLTGSAQLTGTISDNTINSLYYGIYSGLANSSSFAADINNNTINSAYYHIETASADSSTYSGNIIGNTFFGQDNDDTIYWSIATSGTVTSTISNNVFTGNYGAIDLANTGTGMTTIDIANNTIQNSSNAGIAIANSGSNFQTTVSGNTFQGFGVNAAQISNTAGLMCLKFNDNTSNPYPNAYVISATGGTLNLVTPKGNLGQLQATGTIPVSQCLIAP